MTITLESLLGALRRGALLGATALGACAGTSASSTSDAGSPQVLDPYPLDGLGCSGPSLDGGYFGQCCVSALCYTPDSGVCAPASQAGLLGLPGYPPGSGSCICGTTSGPYAPRADQTTQQSGSCCYLVGSIGCTGRPFTTPSGPLLAGLVRRVDWAQPMHELFA